MIDIAASILLLLYMRTDLTYTAAIYHDEYPIKKFAKTCNNDYNNNHKNVGYLV